MRWLRQQLDHVAPTFEKGGKLHRWHPLWEAMDTFFYSPSSVTTTGAHVRDAIDLKRMMMTVVIAALPCVFMAMFNTGLQANLGDRSGQGRAARRLAARGDRPAGHGLFAVERHRQSRARRAVLPAALHRHDGRRPHLGGAVRDRAQGRGQRRLLRHRHPVPADPAADDAAVAGRARHQLRRGDRQGSVRRHRHELHQPGAGGAGVPVLRLSRARSPATRSGRRCRRARRSTASPAPRCLGRCA